MKVHELKKLIDKVIDTEAEVRIGHEDDNFFDGETVTGIQIIHNFVDGNDAQHSNQNPTFTSPKVTT